MGMIEFAGQTGQQVNHDWISAPFVKPPEKTGAYIDAVILGRTRAWSENRFARKVGTKDQSSVPAVIETDVLLCEHAQTGVPFRLAVRGAGLVPGLCRHVKGIGWPRGGEEPDERDALVMFDVPVLLSIRCNGTRKADVGAYFLYSVGEVVCDDVDAFVADYRRKCAGNPEAIECEPDNEIPF